MTIIQQLHCLQFVEITCFVKTYNLQKSWLAVGTDYTCLE